MATTVLTRIMMNDSTIRVRVTVCGSNGSFALRGPGFIRKNRSTGTQITRRPTVRPDVMSRNRVGPKT
jgi:hypothetical protein